MAAEIEMGEDLPKVRVALLAGGASIHTIRWANGLNAAGVEVHLISQHPLLESVDDGVYVYLFPFRGVLGYFTMALGVRRLLEKIKPDLVNAHYASGYATAARLARYRPWLLSVWGSDVYIFPTKSPLHRWWAASNLMAADAVASTSHSMAQQVRYIAPDLQTVEITPFGVDFDGYSQPVSVCADESLREDFVIGTVKSMSHVYGIDILLRTFKKVVAELVARQSPWARRIHLRLVGGGSEMESLQALAASLGLSDKVTFVGRVPHEKVPVELSKLDVFVALSRSESFGVAAIEAGAAGLPVVVSDVGGLPEVVIDGETGLVVPSENADAAAEAIMRLLEDPELRCRLGAKGREHVAANYSWPACVKNMIEVFRKTVSASS